MIDEQFFNEIQKAAKRIEELTSKKLVIAGCPDTISKLKDCVGESYSNYKFKYKSIWGLEEDKVYIVDEKDLDDDLLQLK